MGTSEMESFEDLASEFSTHIQDGISDNEDVAEGCERPTIDTQYAFVLVVQRYPVLLQKSQVPSVKAAKEKAARACCAELEGTVGLKLTVPALFKKLSNMRTSVKKKTEMNQTGDKKLVLMKWEECFLELVQSSRVAGMNDNTIWRKRRRGTLSKFGIKRKAPQIRADASHVQEAVTCKLQTPSCHRTSALQALAKDAQNGTPDGREPPPPRDVSKRAKLAENVLDAAETAETKLLSTSQLKRLVLLEQLKLIKQKQQRLAKLQAYFNI